MLVVLLLLEEIIDLQIHLQNRFFSPLVMQRDDKGTGRRRRDDKVNVRLPDGGRGSGRGRGGQR